MNALTPGDPVASIRLGVHFGPGEGKRFLIVEWPFDGTPDGFDTALEACRVAFHERAGASSRPCGFAGPWSQKQVEATVPVASVKYVVKCWCRDCTGEDYLGCYEGEPWQLGPFDSRAEAEQAGHEETDDCGPWEFEIRALDTGDLPEVASPKGVPW